MNQLIARSSTSTDWPEQALPQAWIERLFEKMLCEYGAKFSNQWGALDPHTLKRHWAQRLAGLTAEQLRAGLEALERHEWPPTLPEFVKLCKPALDPLRAYHEALSGFIARDRGQVGDWSHPAIYYAACRIGRVTLEQTEYRQIRERWEMVLADVLAEGSWETITAPDLQVGLSASPERVQQALAELRCLRETFQPKGGIGWAEKIIARHESGDAKVTPAMLDNARAVLGRQAVTEGEPDAPAEV